MKYYWILEYKSIATSHRKYLKDLASDESVTITLDINEAIKFESQELAEQYSNEMRINDQYKVVEYIFNDRAHLH